MPKRLTREDILRIASERAAPDPKLRAEVDAALERQIERDLRVIAERLELTSGDGFDSQRVCMELYELTGIDVLTLMAMDAGEVDRLVRAGIRKRKTDRSKIPPDKRLGPWTKRKAAKLLGRQGDPKRAVEWLNRCIDDGTIRYQQTSRQSGYFHRDDFPK